MTSKEFIGADLEKAYAKVFNGTMTGGFADKGYDVTIPDTGIRVQVKSSVKGAVCFLAEGLRRKHFIPLCVGEPSVKEEMIQSIRSVGGWVGYNIAQRVKLLEQIALVRKECAV